MVVVSDVVCTVTPTGIIVVTVSPVISDMPPGAPCGISVLSIVLSFVLTLVIGFEDLPEEE